MFNKNQSAIYGFTTYKNYLMALSFLLEDYGSIASKRKPVDQKQNIDFEKIKGLLMNSWNSELLLNLPAILNEDFLKFSNHWSPVQSYYSIYLASRALIVAKNFNANGDHSTTLEIISSNFIQTEKLFSEPWNFLFDVNGTLNVTDPQIRLNPLENPYFFRSDKNMLIASLIMFLRTTYERIIDEKCEEWRIKNPINGRVRKRLSPGVRDKIKSNQRKVSLFDCLYRLRIRSNYKDVDIFILGSTTPETKRYFDSLCKITDRTLFLLENYICAYIGIKKMTEIVSEYKKADNLGLWRKVSYSPIKRVRYYK